MKKRYLFIFIAVLVSVIVGMKVISFVSQDRDKTINYGSLNVPIASQYLKKQQCHQINREGMAVLNVHGSGIINYNDFTAHYKGDMDKLYIINLLPDHLYYYKNRCLSWYGLGSTEKTLGQLRNGKIKSRIKKFFIRLLYGFPPIEDRTQIQTEEEVVRHLGAHYYMPLKNGESWPAEVSYVDDLISFFENLPPDATLYFHCVHGKGRTTTFIVLYDIFKNHKKVPLTDIIKRHYCLGREDLFNTTLWENGYWTQEALNARKNFVVQFYVYMNATDGYSRQTFQQWINQQNFDTTPVRIHR